MQVTVQSPEQDTAIIKTVIKWQLVVFVGAIITIKWAAPTAFKSVTYGSMVALLNSGFLYWRMRRAALSLVITAENSLKQVQRAGVERFLLVGGMLAIGMAGRLKLSPITVLISFIMGQLVFLLGVTLTSRKAK